jgi:hypothetical protein
MDVGKMVNRQNSVGEMGVCFKSLLKTHLFRAAFSGED